MATWVRVDTDEYSATETDAYIDIDQYGYLHVFLNPATSEYGIQASTVDNSQSATLNGSWATHAEASKALQALTHGYDAGIVS